MKKMSSNHWWRRAAEEKTIEGVILKKCRRLVNGLFYEENIESNGEETLSKSRIIAVIEHRKKYHQ